MNNREKDEVFSSGELARMVGISADTLRHYERKRVLGPPRRAANGYREYSSQALERVKLVRRALAVGFTLDELAEILQTRDRGGAPCKSVREAAAAKLANVEEQLTSLVQLRKELRGILEEWDSLLEKFSPGQPVHLLESLASRAGSAAQRNGTANRSLNQLKKRKKEK
jgi:DNA-binding transcriptional MerR regulator